MSETQQRLIAFGPVPSRRLGRSLGINNIPPKSCSYSCIYCQVGATQQREIQPRNFFPPEQIAQAVRQQVQAAQTNGETIDYLTFVPDGEPTLDSNLGSAIDLLRPLGIKIAVISNASLIWREEVRDILSQVDWVSLKVDSVKDDIWRQINQPHLDLELSGILQGIQTFAQSYTGVLTTETMLVAGCNDQPADIEALSEFLRTIKTDTTYLAVPIRPPAQAEVQIPGAERIVQAFTLLNNKLKNVQYLIGYEGNSFANTGEPRRDLLAITAVHPMRQDAVRNFLARTGLDWRFIEELLRLGELVKVKHAGHYFYLRRPKFYDKNSLR